MTVPLGGGVDWISPFRSAASRIAATGAEEGRGWESLLSGIAGGVSQGASTYAAKKLRREEIARQEAHYQADRADRLKEEQFHNDIAALHELNSQIDRIGANTGDAAIMEAQGIAVPPEMKAQASRLTEAMRQRDVISARVFNGSFSPSSAGGQATAPTTTAQDPFTVYERDTPLGKVQGFGPGARAVGTSGPNGQFTPFAQTPPVSSAASSMTDASSAGPLAPPPKMCKDGSCGSPHGPDEAHPVAAPDDVEGMMMEAAAIKQRQESRAAMLGSLSPQRRGRVEAAVAMSAAVGADAKRLAQLETRIKHAEEDRKLRREEEIHAANKTADDASKSALDKERTAAWNEKHPDHQVISYEKEVGPTITTMRGEDRDERAHAWRTAERKAREDFIREKVETQQVGADRRKQLEIDASTRMAAARMGAADEKARDAKAKSVVDELKDAEKEAFTVWTTLREKAAKGQIGHDDPDLVGGVGEGGEKIPSAWERYQEAKIAHEKALRDYAHPDTTGEDRKAAVLRSFSLLPKAQQTDEVMSKMLKDAELIK